MNDISILLKYFPDLTSRQQEQFSKLKDLYEHWNAQINVISRKDIDLLYERHVLHSLGIAKVISFKPFTDILDVGTGGGFPGIPLAILFPECKFNLVDSIGKKITVVKEVAKGLGLTNVYADQIRAEQMDRKFDFVVSRAVTDMSEFCKWVSRSFKSNSFNSLPNGILSLKGGDLSEELKPFKGKYKLYKLSDYFKEEFFETKQVVYLPAK